MMAEPTEDERAETAAWLETVGSEAVREFTQTRAHGWAKSRMIEHILATPEAYAVARESLLIERRVRNRAEAQRYAGRSLRRL